MDSILKNFRNPWEDDNWVLQTNVLETNVLDTSVLETNVLDTSNYSSVAYYFDSNGNFLGAFKAKSDYLKIVQKDKIDIEFIKKTYRKKNDNQVFRATLNKFSDYLEDVELDKTEGYSKLFTTVLERGKFDMSKVHNGKISIVNGRKIYNNPDPRVGFANTIFDEETKTFKISINIQRTSSELTTVSNIISALGVHEYTGHGINRWRDGNKQHYKVYELQFKHSSWKFTTNGFKSYMVDNYLDYTYKEVSNDYYYRKHAELKEKYGHLKEFKDVWRY